MIIDEMKRLTDELKSIDPNYEDLVDELLKKEIEVLCRSKEDTIFFLDNADEETISLSCTVWENVSRHFKTAEIINQMSNCINRFPHKKDLLEVNLEYAKKHYINSK